MYKHQIHKGATYLIFIFINLSLFYILIPILFDNINQFTFLNCFLFAIAGAYLFSELYFSIFKAIVQKDFLITIYKHFFIYLGFLISMVLVLGYNWLLMATGYFDELTYTFFSILGGVIWLISMKVATIFPNIPEKKGH
ncbi:hypothetical protein [Heyndrickxia ginsengihumi]|uniref:hypothetical protein n=1 Tax=Heyndrickxia ginsengihumi TaxID=363870 RepID=UPI0020406E80|nr:hypothetical protein [Heyndrickxia ginsengihumi]MCM3025115.1 hypothetical protein [Heyndrickxia ginsengihumi]